MWYSHDLTQLITYADAIIDARQSGGPDPVKVTNISKLPADGQFWASSITPTSSPFYFRTARALRALYRMGYRPS
jgi:hypothetical protein